MENSKIHVLFLLLSIIFHLVMHLIIFLVYDRYIGYLSGMVLSWLTVGDPLDGLPLLTVVAIQDWKRLSHQLLYSVDPPAPRSSRFPGAFNLPLEYDFLQTVALPPRNVTNNWLLFVYSSS